MIRDTNISALRQVQDSSDEELQSLWAGFGIEDNGGQLSEGDIWPDWYVLVVSELIYRGFCFQKRKGKECADQGASVAEMCPGCKWYWVEAARLTYRTTEKWIAECVA
jgi:hypothetical protein